MLVIYMTWELMQFETLPLLVMCDSFFFFFFFSLRGWTGICKVSSLLSCRVDTQPTDMHSLLLQQQPRPLQPLQQLTAMVMAGCTQQILTMPLPLPLATELALW